MYKIVISPRARRELKQIAKLYRRVSIELIEELKDNPYLGKQLTRELTGKYSCRVGVYRMIYKIDKVDKKIYHLSAA